LDPATLAAPWRTDAPSSIVCGWRRHAVTALADAHLLALTALAERPALVYNLGNGHGFSVREVVRTAQQVTGRPIAVREVARRPGDPAILVASSARIIRELGWQPRLADLATIVRTAWAWHARGA